MTGRHWTEDEDALLREHYRHGGSRLVADQLPERTLSAVRTHANKLGLKVHELWTEDEEEILREWWPKEGATVADRLAGRTVTACRRKADYEGIAYRTWEDDALHNFYRNARRGARYEWRLGEQAFNEIVQQPCYYCGRDPQERSLLCPDGERRTTYANGLDRVDPDGAYTIDNVVPCCTRCNVAKNDQTLDEFKGWLSRAYHHFVETE